ncbi:hypothetical protein L7F22_049690, partial [Adiantum nelumboides]|nr:hypothetical protein [Adiantum nelumboides]
MDSNDRQANAQPQKGHATSVPPGQTAMYFDADRLKRLHVLRVKQGFLAQEEPINASRQVLKHGEISTSTSKSRVQLTSK